MRKTDNFGLLIINTQIDFCSQEGFAAKLGRNINPMTKMLPKLKFFYQQCRQLGLPIIFSQYVARKDLSPKNLKINQNREERARLCLLNSYGANFYEVLPKKPDLIIKHRYFDAFAHTQLREKLEAQTVQTLLIAGVRTELSIDATAKRAVSEGFKVVLLADLLATYQENQTYQQQFLKVFDRYYGEVKKSAGIINELRDQYL